MVDRIIASLVFAAAAMASGAGVAAFTAPSSGTILSLPPPPARAAFQCPDPPPDRRRRRRSCPTASAGGGGTTTTAVVLRDSRVDLSEDAVRDTDSLQEWAAAVCGVQQSEGLVLFSDDLGWRDVQIATTADAPAGTCVMYVPCSAFLTSYGSRSEFGRMEGAEKLIGNLAGADQFPLFYLFLKVLVEYERGTESAWYPWLNSLPRIFDSGAAMTPSCYDCLPPLAAKFCMEERVKCINCRQALKTVDFVGDATKADDDLLKWVYNVVATRSLEVDGERIIVPMADMVSVSVGDDHPRLLRAFVRFLRYYDFGCTMYYLVLYLLTFLDILANETLFIWGVGGGGINSSTTLARDTRSRFRTTGTEAASFTPRPTSPVARRSGCPTAITT